MKDVAIVLVLLLAVAACADTAVQFVHLAMTGDPSEMMVGWYTQSNTVASVVKWGPQAGSLPFSARGSSSKWLSDHGFNHFAKITGLRPGQQYYYRCGDDAGGWSAQFSFTAVPPLNSTKSFKMAIYGDMGIVNSQDTIDRLTQRLRDGEISWIFHVGDISYADKHYLDFQKAWNTWFERIQPLAASVPYMVCPGNHEYVAYHPVLYYPSRNFVVYNARFSMPQANSSTHKSMYYSFNYGPVHFVSMSTETSYPGAPFDDKKKFADQVAWLTEDLRVANLPENRKARPWIFVMGHRPVYSSCEGYSQQGVPTDKTCLALQKTFEDIYNKYKVDVIWNGHVHSYERNYPTYRNKKTSDSYVKPSNPYNIITGCAGSVEGLKNEHETKWTQPEPEWSAHRFGSDYGYGILEVINGSQFDWKFYRVGDNGLQDHIVAQR